VKARMMSLKITKQLKANITTEESKEDFIAQEADRLAKIEEMRSKIQQFQ
jgi:hypothetical protein